MAKKKKTVSLKNAEILFGDEIQVIERLKDEELVNDLETILREFEGCANLTISISTETEI